MSAFRYLACEDSGRRLRGVVEASDRDAAVASVASLGIHILEIQEQAGSVTTNGKARRKVSRSDLALFTRRLADLASAGLPLDRALQLAGEQSDNASLAAVTEEAVRDVHAGLPVSEALAKHSNLFPTVFTMTLRAGEASGQFSEVASRLAELQQLEVRRRSQIMGSLLYPCILVCSAIAVVSFMEFFVVPRLSQVFHDLGSDLPISTAILLSVSKGASDNWLPILLTVAAVVFGYRAWMSTTAGKVLRDRWILRMPIAGKIVTRAVVSRYARVLGTLLYGGVPILESLKIAGSAAGNNVFEASSQRVQQDVREGRRLAEAMKDAGAFSNVLVQMVSVGEETGDLPRMLGRVSETLDFEVDQGMQKLTTIVEPLIVLAAGAFIGFVVLSILLPIYQAQDLVK